MAINVKLSKDPGLTGTKSVVSYIQYDFPGITTTGEIFLYDGDAEGATAWYILENSSGDYVPYSGDPNSEYLSITYFPNPTSDFISLFESRVSSLLNSTAVSYGYNSIDNAISYYDSLDFTKREEARSFSSWRDSVEFLADANIFSFTADGVTLPDLAGFTGQTGYAEFSVVPIPTTFFGDEDAGYHITDLENRIFTAWINVDHQGINSGLGQSIQIPFPSGNITDIYSISGIVDQGSQTSDWLNANYSLKIKFSGTANSYGVQTEFDYMIHSLDGYATTYNGLVPRFTIIGGY